MPILCGEPFVVRTYHTPWKQFSRERAIIHEAMSTFWLPLKEGASVNALDPSLHWRPLALAAIHGREAIAHLFVCAYGVDPCPEEGWRNANNFLWGEPAMACGGAWPRGHCAIFLGLPKTSNIDYKVGFDRRTLLALAAVEGHFSIVQLLIGRGAQIDPLTS